MRVPTYKRPYSPYLDSNVKKLLDITVCLILFLPAVIIIAAISFIVLLIDGWPVIFVQKRVGKKGKLFFMPKVRTLKVGTDPNEPSFKQEFDSRTTITGRFLRRHRLDELPQILLVLIGTMSLVGPRPELPSVAAIYKNKENKRLFVKPGITGFWQIMAKRDRLMHQEIKYDLYYLRKASFWLDIKILFLTIPFVLRFGLEKKNHENRLYNYDIPLSK